MAADKKLQIKRMAINREAAIEFFMGEPPKLAGIKPDDIKAYNDSWKRLWADTQNSIRAVLSIKVDGQ